MSVKNTRTNIVEERRKVLEDINTMKGISTTELEFKLIRIDFGETSGNTQSVMRMLRLEGMDVLDVNFEHNYIIVDTC